MATQGSADPIIVPALPALGIEPWPSRSQRESDQEMEEEEEMEHDDDSCCVNEDSVSPTSPTSDADNKNFSFKDKDDEDDGDVEQQPATPTVPSFEDYGKNNDQSTPMNCELVAPEEGTTSTSMSENTDSSGSVMNNDDSPHVASIPKDSDPQKVLPRSCNYYNDSSSQVTCKSPNNAFHQAKAVIRRAITTITNNNNNNTNPRISNNNINNIINPRTSNNTSSQDWGTGDEEFEVPRRRATPPLRLHHSSMTRTPRKKSLVAASGTGTTTGSRSTGTSRRQRYSRLQEC